MLKIRLIICSYPTYLKVRQGLMKKLEIIPVPNTNSGYNVGIEKTNSKFSECFVFLS
jgi:hypothetical protein